VTSGPPHDRATSAGTRRRRRKWPVFKAALLYLAAGIAGRRRRERRRPDLVKITRSAEFVARNHEGAERVAGFFARIEEGAPWLGREADQVLGWCSTSAGSDGLFQPPSFGFSCIRLTTVYYGARGDLTELLEALSGVLGKAGWGRFQPSQTDWAWVPDEPGAPRFLMRGHAPPVRAARLVPAEPGGARRGMVQRGGPDMTFMDIGWTGSGESPRAVVELSAAAPSSGRATPIYQPVTMEAVDVPVVIKRIRAEYPHVIAIRIWHSYYGSRYEQVLAR
jgi:hypothetical protein